MVRGAGEHTSSKFSAFSGSNFSGILNGVLINEYVLDQINIKSIDNKPDGSRESENTLVGVEAICPITIFAHRPEPRQLEIS